MNYTEAVKYLFSTLPVYQIQGESAIKKMGLHKISTLCEALGNPQKDYKTIHITGTNGKGSTAHTLAAILQVAGYTTGLYTSPHLQDFRERIRVNGISVNKAYVAEFVQKYQHLFEKHSISFFEMSVGMAFSFFASKKVDIAVIEVGLGGRLDATNIIIPEASVITNISLDHTHILGNTLAKIAYEKAGIIKQGVPVVVGTYQAETAPVFNQVATNKQAPLYNAFTCYKVEIIDKTHNNLLVNAYKKGSNQAQNLVFGLGGLYQAKNLPAILTTIDILVAKGFNISQSHLCHGLANIRLLTSLRGRWEVLATNPTIICDVAHNRDGIAHIMKQLTSLSYTRLHIVFGMVKNKDAKQILATLDLLPCHAHYYFCKADIARALDVETLTAFATAKGLIGTSHKSVKEALKQAKKNACKEDIIFIGGSTYVVGEALESIRVFST